VSANKWQCAESENYWVIIFVILTPETGLHGEGPKARSSKLRIEIESLKISRFTDDFPNPHIKKIILVGWFQNQGCIGTAAGPADDNNVIAA
jgi:hypothetical protein